MSDSPTLAQLFRKRPIALPEAWSVEDTGGNCDGWRFNLHDHAYAFVTTQGAPSAPERWSDPVTLSVYDTETDRQLIAIECASVRIAVRIALSISFVQEVQV